MIDFRFTCIATVVLLLIFISFDIATCNLPLDSTIAELAANGSDDHVERTEESLVQDETIETKKSTGSHVEKGAPSNPSSTSIKSTIKEKVRMVSKEELALHDGKRTPTVWLSILSQVFDVSAGPEYYSEDGPYRVFVGRDANVPFVTGKFNPEEAKKPLSTLEPHELSNLQHWLQFYIDEDKYPFIGLLEGDLYDKDGNPTEEKKLIDDKIAIVKANVENRKKKTANIIARRQNEDEERKKKQKQERFEELRRKHKYNEEKWNRLAKKVLSSVWQFFQGKKEETNIENENEL